ncbi:MULTISPECIES: SDR family NAD(P)-dependent oxidoreductase [Paraburkholderia]|uniref:SDR family oxidoreductase n=2 Tax=Paraburkholderia TaxID=1822464 RepID=A0ABU9SMW6_9BURK|nr:SDR family oxidoreductase [Paraburkholderia nodosa]
MSDADDVVIISGGSRGLGLALVRTCLSAGRRVATFSRARTGDIDDLIERDTHAARFHWQAVDSTDSAAVSQFVAGVADRWGGVSSLVNNAGVSHDGLLALMREDAIEQMIAVNLTGTILLTQSCTKWMLRANRGAIVNIASVNAIRGHAGVAVYSATKAALDGLTRSLARELGACNVRVNSVAPGYFESDMVQHLDEKARARIARRTPLGRLADTTDITNVVEFLISDRASFVTGQTVAVDGGITC